MPNPPDKCRVPGCDRLAAIRGLCRTHYWHAQNSTPNSPYRAAALNYILPSRQGQRPPRPQGDLADSGRPPSLQAQRIDKAVGARGNRAEIRIEAIYEFAKALKIKCIGDTCDGFLFEHPTRAILVRLDDAGNLHEGDFVAKGKA